MNALDHDAQAFIEDLRHKAQDWRETQSEAGHPFLPVMHQEPDPAAEHLEHMRKRLPQRYRYSRISTPLPDDSLYLVGKAGTGKTHAAAATALSVASDGGRFAWVNVPHLLASLRASYGGAEAPPSPDELVRGVALIVLDDLGAERVTDWSREALYDLINTIYESEVRVIVTSNVRPSELVRTLGERLVSRLIEECSVVTFDGPDRRRVKAAAR